MLIDTETIAAKVRVSGWTVTIYPSRTVLERQAATYTLTPGAGEQSCGLIRANPDLARMVARHEVGRLKAAI